MSKKHEPVLSEEDRKLLMEGGHGILNVSDEDFGRCLNDSNKDFEDFKRVFESTTVKFVQSIAPHMSSYPFESHQILFPCPEIMDLFNPDPTIPLSKTDKEISNILKEMSDICNKIGNIDGGPILQKYVCDHKYYNCSTVYPDPEYGGKHMYCLKCNKIILTGSEFSNLKYKLIGMEHDLLRLWKLKSSKNLTDD